jgi:hypothetical protein
MSKKYSLLQFAIFSGDVRTSLEALEQIVLNQKNNPKGAHP